jgi:hypothetical protein
VPLGSERSESEVGWVAGFYCGEGTCYAHRGTSDRYYVCLVVGNTDLESLQRCQRVMGGKIYGPYKPKDPLGKKDAYTLKLDSRSEVEAALAVLLPHLTVEKKDQVDRALAKAAANPPVDPKAFWRTRVEKFGPSGGNRPRTLVPVPCKREHDLGERYEYTDPKGRTMFKCRACQREKDAERRVREKRAAKV